MADNGTRRDMTNAPRFVHNPRPLGNIPRPLGDTPRPLGDGTRPMGDAPRPIGYGTRPIGDLVAVLTRVSFKRHSSAAVRIILDWSAIIGPALAAVTSPRRLSGDTLTIACSGPIAMELQHLASEVTARINSHLGTPSVQTLRFTQATSPGVTASRAAAAPKPPSPVIRAKVEASVAGIPGDDLREALARLGAAVLTARNAPSKTPGKPSMKPIPKR